MASTSLHPAVVETHISVVFFVGDRAYKLKKGVRFDFLDYSTRSARELACHREVELNRRIAPDVYEGVADVIGPDGDVQDHLVVMTRLPDARRLSTLVTSDDPELDHHLDAIADVVARFHETASRGAEIDAVAWPDALLHLWRTNASELVDVASGVVDVERIHLADHLATTFVEHHGALLRERVEAGAICDGHGDLQADDVFCMPEGPQVLDCIDFDDRLRFGDVANDVAFLAMDLERLGAPDAAASFVAAYERRSGGHLPRALLDLYVAYRALVRAKIHCLRARTAIDPTSAATATALVELALLHLRQVPVMVVVGGLPGTGKSTLAHEVGHRLDAAVLSSDVVRKQGAGISGTHRDEAFEQGLYDTATTDRVYDELVVAAGRELASGDRSVVLDASWRTREHRAAARAVARRTATPVVEVRCTLPRALAAARIDQRRAEGVDESDATAAIADAMARSFDEWPEAVVVDTQASTTSCADDVLAHVATTRSRLG